MWEKIKDWCYWHEGVVTFIGATICAFIIVGLMLQYESQFYVVEEQMIVEVTDMEKTKSTQVISTGKTLVPRTVYRYELTCGDVVFSVDSAVYNSTSIGDRIIINCKYKYRKDNNALVNESYEYAGD